MIFKPGDRVEYARDPWPFAQGMIYDFTGDSTHVLWDAGPSRIACGQCSLVPVRHLAKLYSEE